MHTRTHTHTHTPVHTQQVYLAGHHLLLAHAAAVNVYRRAFAPAQRGAIGVTLNANWNEPARDHDACADAARRLLLWALGWFADPIWLGDYPQEMRDRCGDRLPAFTVRARVARGAPVVC
jgi:beta-glucosidase/6-phospho-beta-glucosidase/beta-galactosidase